MLQAGIQLNAMQSQFEHDQTLSAQNAFQTMNLADRQATNAQILSKQEAGQTLTKDEQAFEYQKLINDQTAGLTMAQSDKDFIHNYDLAQQKATNDASQSRLNLLNTLSSQNNQGDIDKTLTTLKAGFDADAQALRLSSADTNQYVTSASSILQQTQANITNINNQPDTVLTATAKQNAINSQISLANSSVDVLKSIYASGTVSWNDSASTGDIPPLADTTSPIPETNTSASPGIIGSEINVFPYSNPSYGDYQM